MVYVQWLSLSCLCWSVWHSVELWPNHEVQTNLKGVSVYFYSYPQNPPYSPVLCQPLICSAICLHKRQAHQGAVGCTYSTDVFFCFFLVVPPALSTLWWFRDSKAIISVPPLPTPPVSPLPLTPPIISVPPASISVTTITVAAAAAAVAVPVPVAVSISVPMAIPVSVAILSAVSIAPVTVAVVTVSMAPPVLRMSVPWAVSLCGRWWRREVVLWTCLTGGHWAQTTRAGEAGHGHGDAQGPFWTVGGLCWHRAQAAGTGPTWRAATLDAELRRAAGRSHKVALILGLEEKETLRRRD